MDEDTTGTITSRRSTLKIAGMSGLLGLTAGVGITAGVGSLAGFGLDPEIAADEEIEEVEGHMSAVLSGTQSIPGGYSSPFWRDPDDGGSRIERAPMQVFPSEWMDAHGLTWTGWYEPAEYGWPDPSTVYENSPPIVLINSLPENFVMTLFQDGEALSQWYFLPLRGWWETDAVGGDDWSFDDVTGIELYDSSGTSGVYVWLSLADGATGHEIWIGPTPEGYAFGIGEY